MTASPLLPPGMAGRMAETEATDVELSRMTELATCPAPPRTAVPGRPVGYGASWKTSPSVCR
jgi:hypothetical protein